jgi:hypothetical protein
VFGSVFIFRTVATANMAASHTHSKLHPNISGL